MAYAEYFRRQAERCLRLSRTSFDMETSRQLRLMASEFMQKADEFEHNPDCFRGPHETSGSTG